MDSRFRGNDRMYMNFKDLLPKNLPFKEAPQKEYYFAINISPKEVVGVVWGIEAKSLKVINSATASYEDQEGLAQACNQVLDEALGSFQPEPTKILFGVPDNWLIDENLKDEYLNLLKHLVKELDVEPMAYVSTTHAICHLLQKQTGVPSTAILIDTAGPVDDTLSPLRVTVVKAGKIIGTKSAKRTEDLPQDIEKVLMSFSGVEVLPSKIALYGSDQASLNKYKDELTSFNWMNNLPFLHLPKVETLEDGIGIKAISLAGATEIEPDVIYGDIDLPKGAKKPLVSRDLAEVNEKQSSEILEAVDATKAGFVKGDIKANQLDGEGPLQEEVELRPRQQVAQYQQSEPRFEEEPSSIQNILSKVRGFLAAVPLADKLPFF